MELTDPRAIRALAHPLRLDLLDLLTAEGPATAAQCGRMLGSSQASCSFHLRQLAKYGFVEDGGEGRDRRERVWRVPTPRPELRVRGAERQLQRLVLEREYRAVLDWLERREDATDAWSGASEMVAGVALLTPEEAAELGERMRDLADAYLRGREAEKSSGDADRRPVRILLAATPDHRHETEESTHAGPS